MVNREAILTNKQFQANSVQVHPTFVLLIRSSTSYFSFWIVIHVRNRRELVFVYTLKIETQSEFVAAVTKRLKKTK